MKRIVFSAALAALASFVASNAEAKTWHKMNGTCATSISAADGLSPWAIGCTNGDSAGDLPILFTTPIQYNVAAGTSSWNQVLGAARWVSAATQTNQAAPNVYVWVVQNSGAVFKGLLTSGTNVTWTEEMGPGSATTVSVNPSYVINSAYFTTYTPGNGGYGFRGFTEGHEVTVYPGAGASFAVTENEDMLWATGETNGAYFMKRFGEWVQEGNFTRASFGTIAPVTPAAGCVGGCDGGAAYTVGTDGDIHYWNGKVWSSTGFPTRQASQVSGAYGTSNVAWALDTSGVIWTYQ
ncbi:MAG TPA: hypothetical protein VGI39_33730 [Polyangiaceae bacterium]|jgi:hypothetical protein